ncbi:hypothetical protein GIB67_023936 [Kingdonia uniflora]|uniref:Uncharacterized protein n=1 Tax=Kingdonia uniflora TaxID=39325 RepID=A0A7J7M6D5_9MAGN|nr:hypothetical protein GIB67_023936 [Kingdonia uniflora]
MIPKLRFSNFSLKVCQSSIPNSLTWVLNGIILNWGKNVEIKMRSKCLTMAISSWYEQIWRRITKMVRLGFQKFQELIVGGNCNSSRLFARRGLSHIFTCGGN